MSDSESVKFPRMPASRWWDIRSKFNKKVPNSVTGSYLETFLPMSADSASKNLIPPLKAVKLIDEDGKPTDLAFKWRDDEQYSEVCKEIREAVYPEELLDAFTDSNIDSDALTRWFANRSRVGQGAARQMATFYKLLADADPSKSNESSTNSGTSTSGGTKKSKSTKPKEAVGKNRAEQSEEVPPSKIEYTPSLHIDVQVHISPESSAEQIDAIFASMAKHLYKDQS